ncbi:hypothetical protein [Citrobacter freundii]|uniref:hypothetical protein n=1 Tax=Citrobacter freundii TaxID=546 RepID=UPI0039797E1E
MAAKGFSILASAAGPAISCPVSGLAAPVAASLVESRYFITTGILTFVGSGLSHEEYWRYIDPEEYLEVYEDGEIPNDASSLEKLDIYSPQLVIARQSLWYGHDNYVDDFIVSLTGGLFHTSDLSKYLS